MVHTIWLRLLHWLPVWLNGAWPTIADVATFGLAALGLVIALKPPADGKRFVKAAYLVLFALLAALGLTANAEQRAIEQARQDVLQQNETDARNQFHSDLEDVKSDNHAILHFVAHPPKGFTGEQVASTVQSFLQQHDEANGVVPDSELRKIAPGIISGMEEQANKWEDEDRAIWNQENAWKAKHQNNPTQQETEDGLGPLGRQRGTLNAQNSQQVLPTMITANFLREELLRGSDQTQEDQDNTQIFYTVLSGEPISWGMMRKVTGYMESLVKRRLPDSAKP